MAETWVFNNTLQIIKELSSSGEFTSNGTTFSLMKALKGGTLRFYSASGNYMDVYANNAWLTDIGDYKTVTFSEAQTGSFREWLEVNATLQEDTTVVEYLTTNIDLKKVANAIRAKGGTTAKLSFPDGFALAISNISTSGGAKETWVLNETISALSAFSFSVSFTSNGASYAGIKTVGAFSPVGYNVGYTNSSGSSSSVYFADTNKWANQAYRKLTFDAPPTGDLLTWLQANGVKQPDDTAVQDTKALTITSNGTVSVTPDAPYDALKKVDVTVDVESGGGTETTPVEVYGVSDTIDVPIFCTWQTENGWLGTSTFELTSSNGDFLFTIPDVLVGGYIVLTKDPMSQSLFQIMRPTGVEWITVEPMPESGDVPNASCVVKVVEPGANFRVFIQSA